MATFAEQLQELEQKIAQKEQLDKQLPILYEAQKACIARAERCEAELNALQQEVSRFEKGGFQNLFYSVIGKKQIVLQEGKKQILQAKKKAEEARAAADAANNEVEACEKAIYELDGCDRLYHQLIREKKAQVRASDSPVNQEIVLREAHIGELDEWVRELNEVIHVGEEVVETLEDMLKHLDVAIQYKKEDAYIDSEIAETYNDYSIYKEIKLMKSYSQSLKVRVARFQQVHEHATSLNITQEFSCDAMPILCAVATDSFYQYKYFREFHGRLTELRGFIWKELDDLDEQKQAVEREQDRLRAEMRQLIAEA